MLAFSVAQFWHFSAATLRTGESVKHPINHTKYSPPNSFTAHNNPSKSYNGNVTVQQIVKEKLLSEKNIHKTDHCERKAS